MPAALVGECVHIDVCFYYAEPNIAAISQESTRAPYHADIARNVNDMYVSLLFGFKYVHSYIHDHI